MANKFNIPCTVAALIALVTGFFLLLGGWGHLTAILASRADQPFDYRFVSLLTTSGILFLPGLVSIGMSYGLLRGKTWAYVSCLLSMGALMLYLLLLVYMKSQVPEGQSAAGDEVYFFTLFAAVYMVTLATVFAWSRVNRLRAAH